MPSLADTIKDGIQRAIHEILFGTTFDEWKAGIVGKVAGWRAGVVEASAILIVGFVLAAFMEAMDARGAARTLRPVSKLMALARILTAIFGRV